MRGEQRRLGRHQFLKFPPEACEVVVFSAPLGAELPKVGLVGLCFRLE
jgi:hypothetical protein